MSFNALLREGREESEVAPGTQNRVRTWGTGEEHGLEVTGEAREDESHLLMSTYGGGPANTSAASFSSIHTPYNSP